ncbi:MAG: PhoU domain-containing protein [Thomasclavelia sp.]
MHTIFNVVKTILLLPFGNKLVKLAFMVLPEKEGLEDKLSTKYLDASIFTDDYHIGTSAIANTQLFNETQNMLNVVQKNVQRSFELIVKYDEEKHEKLLRDEKYIDYLNKEIIQFTTNAISSELPIEESKSIGLPKDFWRSERVGDHAVNIANRAKKLYDENAGFTMRQ